MKNEIISGWSTSLDYSLSHQIGLAHGSKGQIVTHKAVIQGPASGHKLANNLYNMKEKKIEK